MEGSFLSKTRKKYKEHLKTRIRTYGLICLVVLVIALLSFILLNHPETSFNLGGKKAAIIDGLSIMYENNTFWWTARDILKKAGYTTYYYKGGADTVTYIRIFRRLILGS